MYESTYVLTIKQEAQTKLAEVSKSTSEAIKGLIATLKLGIAGSKDCDEAMATIATFIKQLDEPIPRKRAPHWKPQFSNDIDS